MSEQKRNTLTSLGTNKKDKKNKEVLKTVRFTLELHESNEEACPEFHYSVLLNSEERKRKARLKAKAEGQINGVDPTTADDKKLKEIARRFEEKYGGKKKHSRYEDYVDLGAGYDETDPFIDNTDAYDEVVPEEMTTAHGGFYINCGALEFKEVSDQSDAEERNEFKPRKRIKNTLPVIEDKEDSEEPKVSNNVEIKKPDLDADVQKENIKKRKIISHDREILKKKKKRAIDDLTKRKSVTVKELLREKRESLDLEIMPVVQVQPEQKSPVPTPIVKPTNTSITEVIESVISAACEDDRSKDSESSASKSGSLITSDTEESQDVPEKEKISVNEDVKLPDNLEEDLKELISSLRRRASESSTEGKCRFFSTDVNSMLLKVELKCRTVLCSSRQAVYEYLANYLPCTKDTLMKRAKKLIIKEEEGKMQEYMRKLKLAIDRMMPVVLDNYSKECQRVAEEKSIEELPSPGSDSEAGEGDKEGIHQKTEVPRRRFPWNNEIRSLLCEVVRIKLHCLELLKPRKDNVDLNLRKFLEAEIIPLWQPGWMKVSTLLRESREIHTSAFIKAKKPPIKKFATVPSSVIGVPGNVSFTTGNVPAFSQAPTENSSMRLKTSSVSITMTSVPTSTSQTTSKTKSINTSESSAMPMRTKSSNTVQNVNSQTRVICSSASVPASISPNFIYSNIQSTPISMNSAKLSGSQIPSSPNLNRKKTGTDLTLAKVSNPLDKNSVNFKADKLSQPTQPSVKHKVIVDSTKSSKTLDLSTANSNVFVNIPGSPNKNKGNSLDNNTLGNVQKSASLCSLPLMNIPDCISVTPTPSPAAISTNLSPSVATTPKPIMSLKQRILHDTNLEQAKLAPPVIMKGEDDGIEVIEIRKTEVIKSVCKQPVKSQISQPNSESKKKKKEIPKEVMIQNVTPSTIPIEKGTTEEIKTGIKISQQKEVERQIKDEEETAAAADFLSQINESLKNCPNSLPNSGNKDTFQDEERLINNQDIGAQPFSPSPQIGSLSPPSVLSPISDQKVMSSFVSDEKDIFNHSKEQILKSSAQNPQNNEESVQMEMDRVMKELIQLQGHFSAEKSGDLVDLGYSSPKVTAQIVTSNCSSAIPSVRTQQSKLKQCTDTPHLGKRLSTGSAEMAKMNYGFQDEFQKHLFLDNLNKQDSEVPNVYKVTKSKAPLAYPHINQSTEHSSNSGRHNQNSSLEGRVADLQSRGCSNSNPATHYPKLMSTNVESFTGASYLNTMISSMLTGMSHIQDNHTNAHISQSGSTQHSPHINSTARMMFENCEDQ